MDTFELDSDAFYICTEISPQNFVVQKAIQIDKSQLERMVGKFDGKSTVENATTSPDSSLGTSSSPGGTSPTSSALGVNGSSQVPPIPYWFNRECKTRLMMLGPQPQGPPNLPMFPSSSTHFGPPTPAPPVTHEDLKQQLKNQLEYYFSRENLISDRYLKCQMDEDQFVPIAVVAEFRKIRNLTNDVNLIVEALKDSLAVELDETCEKVRPITRRTTVIIREVPEDRQDIVEELLSGGPVHSELQYGLNKSWYVTFDSELNTQLAYLNVLKKDSDSTHGKVCARIKAGGPPTSGPAPDAKKKVDKGKPTATVSNGEASQLQLRELGQTLSEYGFVPVASFRPGESLLSHFSYQSRTCTFAGNSLGYTQPPPPLLQNSLVDPQLQPAHFFYQAHVPNVPRNFDEYSTASSNSTHTTASNHNNRSGSSNGGVNGANHYNQNQYNESRSSFSNSNEWRGRGGSGGRFQNNQNHNETNGRQTNGRGNWRGARHGTLTNGHGNQNHRQNGQQSNWRNEQNGQHNNWRNDQNVPQNNWKSEQNGQHQSSSSYRNQENGHHNNWKNENRSHSSNQWWLSNNGETSRSYNNHHNNRQNPPMSSSSSSSLSSKPFSPNALETFTNSGPSTPPPPASGKQQYNATPSDIPPPPVWPAPNYDRRRKSSEASSTTITANTATNTLTPSTPVISAEDFPAFADAQESVIMEKSKDVKEKQWKDKPVKEKSVEDAVEKSKINPKLETTKGAVAEKEKLRSPPVAPVPAPTPTFAFEETAFPSLPKKVEPVKPPQKPTFSSVAAGRRNVVKQMAPEKKTSYAEKLKQRQALLRK